MKKYLISFILFSLTVPVFGQNKTYLGIQGGLSFDRIELFDYGNQLMPVSLISSSAGITLSHDFGKYFSL